MNDYLPAVTINPSVTVRNVIIWLHGLGADGHDFEPIAAELQLPEVLAVRFVFPHAPQRPITVNGGYVMRAWYDIESTELAQAVDTAGIQQSVAEVTTLIERELAQGIPAERILLAGFSQGGLIALETALRYPLPLAGVLALSTYLPEPEKLPAISHALPVFLAHGSFDNLVPYAAGQRARQLLQQQGHSVTWHSYPMQHSVCGQEILDIRGWLLDHLHP